MSSTGRRLRESNEEILKYINQLREQRNELGFLVDKQKIEKSHLEAEMARISYKLSLINKSLGQRLRTLTVYDETLSQIESKYRGLADSTLVFLSQVRKESTNLESKIDKKIGTENDRPDCQTCQFLPQHSRKSICNKNQAILKDIPVKQSLDNERRSIIPDYLSSPMRSARPSMNPDHQLYTRAMEYPMLLSSMMEKDQYDKMMMELLGKTAQLQLGAFRSEYSSSEKSGKTEDNTPEGMTEESLAVEEQIEVSNVTSRTKGSETNSSDQKSPRVNYSDEDFPYIEPSKEISDESDVKCASRVNSPESLKPILPPTSVMNSNTSDMIEKHPDVMPKNVSEDLGSRTNHNNKLEVKELDITSTKSSHFDESTMNSKKNHNGETKLHSNRKTHSGVEVFRQGYKSQHEKAEEPYDLHRPKNPTIKKRIVHS